MRIHRFSPAVLIGIVLCTSGNDRSFAAGNADANENVAAIAAAPEAVMPGAAYDARRAARAAADEGYRLGRTGDFPDAKKQFTRALELDPAFSPAYRLRAAVSLKMSDWTGAIVDLDKLITLDPNDAEIYNERGYARRMLGDLHGAEDDFDRCIALGTKHALAYSNRAEIEELLGEEDAAGADLAAARLLALTVSPAPAQTATPSPRTKQTHHDGQRE